MVTTAQQFKSHDARNKSSRPGTKQQSPRSPLELENCWDTINSDVPQHHVIGSRLSPTRLSISQLRGGVDEGGKPQRNTALLLALVLL